MAAGQPGPWEQELDDFVRAISGAFLFGTPLVFTMEMWWLGTHAAPTNLLAILGIALLANVGLAHFAGFKHRRRGAKLEQAVDALAVGIVGALLMLLALNRVSLGDPPGSIVGKIVLLSLPLSIGASVANAIFASGRGRGGDEREAQPRSPARATLQDVGATIVGGVFIGFSIAPTEEVTILAAELTLAHEIALVVLTLALTYAIVFASGFDPQRRQPPARGFFQTPLTETAMAYVVALAVALGAVYLFDQSDPSSPLNHVVAQVLVLGFPTAVGGAAGEARAVTRASRLPSLRFALALLAAAAAYLVSLHAAIVGGRAVAEPAPAPGAESEQDGQDRSEGGGGRSVAEWTSLAISAMLVLGLVGFLVYQQVAGGAGPAVVEAQLRLDEARYDAGHYYLPVEVRNRGDRTASEVRLRVVAAFPDGQQESADLQIDLLAGGAKRRGVVVFGQDPARADLTVDVVSYLEPS